MNVYVVRELRHPWSCVWRGEADSEDEALEMAQRTRYNSTVYIGKKA